MQTQGLTLAGQTFLLPEPLHQPLTTISYVLSLHLLWLITIISFFQFISQYLLFFLIDLIHSHGSFWLLKSFHAFKYQPGHGFILTESTRTFVRNIASQVSLTLKFLEFRILT
jgi:hypothetical protein